MTSPSLSILVIDDEEQIRTKLKEILRGVGYRVFTVNDGPEALRWILAFRRPDVVLANPDLLSTVLGHQSLTAVPVVPFEKPVVAEVLLELIRKAVGQD